MRAHARLQRSSPRAASSMRHFRVFCGAAACPQSCSARMITQTSRASKSRCDGQGQDAALGLGADRVGALLQGVPRDGRRNRRGRPLRQQGGQRGSAHVQAEPEASEIDPRVPGQDRERGAGCAFHYGTYHTLVVGPATSNTVAKCVAGISDTLVTNVFAQAGKCRVPAIVFACDTAPELDTEAPKGMVKVYPRRIDLENTERLKSFADTQVVETLDELRIDFDH